MKRYLVLLLFVWHQTDAFVIPAQVASFVQQLPSDDKVICLLRRHHQRHQRRHAPRRRVSSVSPSLPAHSVRLNGSALLNDVHNTTALSGTNTTTTTEESSTQHDGGDSSKQDKAKKASYHRPGIPYLHVNWSTKSGLSAQWKTSSSAVQKSNHNDTSAKKDSSPEPVPGGSPKGNNNKSPKQQPPKRSSGRKNATLANYTIEWQPEHTASSSSSSRQTLTPVPVAESILRSIYDKASESTEMAWNMSLQLFPLATTTPLSAADYFGNAAGAYGNLTLATAGKKPSDTLTVKDLERILLQNGFVRQVDVAAALQRNPQLLSAAAAGGVPLFPYNDGSNTNNNGMPGTVIPIEGLGKPVSRSPRGAETPSTSSSSSSSSSSQVAWPQPSVLSYTSIKWGVTVASGFSCMILAVSILPSLWLMGGLVGSLYGYQTGKRLVVDGTVPTSFFPSFLLRFGRWIAKSYLQAYDMVNAMFFMYKTGQLSYDMYKRYASLDERFRIQDKIDAWNAVFVEGKENFDKWEKENEVGRKVLATLRTAWLVEERSLKKTKKSRYRVVQLVYDGAYYAGRFISSLWRLISGGGSTQELSEFLRGIRLDINSARLDEIGSRIRACVAALVAVNIAGALFALSPSFLGILAVTVGLIWPTWFPELLGRTGRLLEETRARGRGDAPRNERSTTKTRAWNVNNDRYSYYIRRNGKKRYYRVAPAPLFRRQQDESKQGIRWPWQKPEPKRLSIFGFRN